MADSLDQIQTLLTSMRDQGRRDAEMKALFGGILTALTEVVSLLEKRVEPAPQQDIAAALAQLTIPAPVVQVTTPGDDKKDWSTLNVDIQKDPGLYGQIKSMTITKT